MEEKPFENHAAAESGTSGPVSAGQSVPDDGEFPSHIRSYVLRQGRATRAQERAWERFGERYLVALGRTPEERAFFEESPSASLECLGPLDLAALFGNDHPVVLEIGFGMGHATAEIAAANPGRNYLGVEVHGPGVGSLLDKAGELGLSNLKIIHHDVVPVLDGFVPPGSLAGVHVFFPDPWRKKRHFKRRLIQAPFLETLAGVCRPEAYLYLATDWADYAQWMLDELAKSPSWKNQYPGWAPAIEWRPSTSFEKKGLAKDHVIREIYALRA
jgi:tRNA (guanine-N7-)-methyltransferase